MNLYVSPYGMFFKRNFKILWIIFGVMLAFGGSFSVYCAIDAFFQKDLYYFLRSLFLFFVFIVVPVMFYFIGNKSGLYIEDGKIYYKAFTKKYYKVEDFAGLLILKSQFQTRYSSPKYIKNKKGEFEYSIIYLNDTRHEFESYENGALDFTTYWARYVHFYTTYDKRVIEYFESKNIPILNKEQIL